jgi:hypothetical protein
MPTINQKPTVSAMPTRPNESNNNLFWPLPADYDMLTEDGQRQARLSVVMDQSTPEKLVIAWEFFRNTYLRPVGESFYRGGFVDSPEMHYQMIQDLGQYARNAQAAPRGTAKSTIIGKEAPLLLALTRPYYNITMGLSTDNLVEDRFDTFIQQMTTNPYIINDFGEQKPKRGQAIWNHHHLALNNGAVLQGISVMGKKRGMRPRLFILDDPEFDPESTSQEASQLLLEKFERILFRQIIPMLEHGAAIFWIGTMINRRSFLFNACVGEDTRFEFWNRRIYSAISYNPAQSGKTSVLWKEKWPQKVLEARRAEIGNAAFQAEYMNDPSSESARMFEVHPIRTEYNIDLDSDSAILWNSDAPRTNIHPITWYEKNKTIEASAEPAKGASSTNIKGEVSAEAWVKQTKAFNEFISKLFIITTFDYAAGLTQYHDYSCIGILGFDLHNIMWILDMWLGRAREALLIENIYRYSQKWQSRVIGIEAESVQIAFANSVDEFFTKKTEENASVWKPRVFPIRYPRNTSKGQRIAGLDRRFYSGRIKYPSHLKGTWPFSMLYAQTHDFTVDLELLRWDDAIDTVAMGQYVVHAKGAGQAPPETTNPTLIERIKKNEPVVKGMPLLSGVDINELDEEIIEALIDRVYEKDYNRKSKFALRRRPDVIG